MKFHGYTRIDLTPRQVKFVDTVILMMKTQIGLGLLAIPTAFNILGLVPGIICLFAVAAITTWADWMIGQFKLSHREVYSIDDVGALIFGPVGRWGLSVIFCLCMYISGNLPGFFS